jgi:hypothetical protein
VRSNNAQSRRSQQLQTAATTAQQDYVHLVVNTSIKLRQSFAGRSHSPGAWSIFVDVESPAPFATTLRGSSWAKARPVERSIARAATCSGEGCPSNLDETNRSEYLVIRNNVAEGIKCHPIDVVSNTEIKCLRRDLSLKD